MRLGTEVPFALCVCLCAPAFLPLLLHVCSTSSHHCCCGVLFCAGRLSSSYRVLLPQPLVGVSPAWCLSPVFVDLFGLLPLPAFTMTRLSLRLAWVFWVCSSLGTELYVGSGQDTVLVLQSRASVHGTHARRQLC